jgi:predicted nucleotidyltransferase
MGDIFNDDFIDFISCLNKHEVKYVLVGGYSVILYGYARTTGDMDIWVKPTEENYKKIVKAFSDFGLSVFDMTEKNFLNTSEYDVFRFGTSPVQIDLMTSVKGLDFDSTFDHAVWFNTDGIKVKAIHINELRKTKKESNRPKDIDDLENLEEK